MPASSKTKEKQLKEIATLGQRGGDTHPIDEHVGERVKLGRTLSGLTQGKLGELVGLTFQQIQKYERGANRVSASKLWSLSKAFDVPIGWFFEEMPETIRKKLGNLSTDTQGEEVADEHITLHRRQSLELVRLFSRLVDPVIRKRVIDVVRAIVESESKH